MLPWSSPGQPVSSFPPFPVCQQTIRLPQTLPVNCRRQGSLRYRHPLPPFSREGFLRQGVTGEAGPPPDGSAVPAACESVPGNPWMDVPPSSVRTGKWLLWVFLAGGQYWTGFLQNLLLLLRQPPLSDTAWSRSCRSHPAAGRNRLLLRAGEVQGFLYPLFQGTLSVLLCAYIPFCANTGKQ